MLKFTRGFVMGVLAMGFCLAVLPAASADCTERLWAGVNNGDIFDEPDTAADYEKTLGAMLDRLVAANLRVLRIMIDYRLELDDDGNALPIGEYNDCILEAVDQLMWEAKRRKLLLLITLQSFNWIEDDYEMSVPIYGWRRCTTPARKYAQLASDPNWLGGWYKSPYQQRTAQLDWGPFLTDLEARSAYEQRVSHILHHRNPYFQGRKWKDINEVIWAWDLMGEPEHLTGTTDELISWLDYMGAYVKAIDPDTYLALGTKLDDQKGRDLLQHNFAAVDIYTVHPYNLFLDYYIDEFLSPTGIGGQYGKLLLMEEFNPYRLNTGLYDEDHFESFINKAESRNMPWMFWEYGYNFDGDDVWHDGVDNHLWNTVIVPHATTMWNTIQPCTGSQWRVGEMVKALIHFPLADANGPYEAECAGRTTDVPLDGSGSTDPDAGDTLTYFWTTTCPGGSFDDQSSATPVLTVDTSAGCGKVCKVSLTVTDKDGQADTEPTTVTIEDTAVPDISCPADVTIECDESTDPNDTGLATVTDECDLNPAVTFSDVTIPGKCLQEFTIKRTWTATDYCENTNSCVQTIEVVDTTPPVISSVSASPEILWPPNHKMRLITVEAVALDNCDPEPVCEIISVKSNEPTNGKGDGNTAPDWEITGNLKVKLRAERAGGGSGRKYTITVKCTDDCDNSATEDTTVTVPHNR